MEILLLHRFIRCEVVWNAVFAGGGMFGFAIRVALFERLLRPARRLPARPTLWLGFYRGGAWVGIYADALIAFGGVDLPFHPLFPRCRFL